MAGRRLLTGIGLVVILMGGMIAVLSRDIVVEDLGAFDWHWVLLLGLTILTLGAAIVLGVRSWSREPASAHALLSLVLSSVILMLLGGLMLAFTSPMELEGIGWVRGFWLGMVGSLLFFLGATCLLLALANRFTRPTLGRLVVCGTVCNVAIATEGVTVMAFAGPLQMGFLSLGEGAVFAWGLILAVLGGSLASMPFLHELRPEWRWLDRLGLSIGVIVALAGLAVVALSDEAVLGEYHLSLGVMVALGAQLTALAVVSMFSLAFSPLGRARAQGTAFVSVMVLLLALPLVAVLAHL